MELPVMPPVAPMLAKPVDGIPSGDYVFEPKWDGFRTIVFRDGDEVEFGSRNERPMTRYFPELVTAALAELPARCVIDGEIVLPDFAAGRLDFEALQLRLHPAASRAPPAAGGEPGAPAGRADAGPLRRVRPARAGRRRLHRAPVRRAAGGPRGRL